MPALTPRTKVVRWLIPSRRTPMSETRRSHRTGIRHAVHPPVATGPESVHRHVEAGSSRRPALRFPSAMVLAGSVVALASSGRLALGTPPPPVVQTRLALDHLGQAAIDWQNTVQCSGCHKQPVTLAAYATAASNGHDAPRPGVVDALITGTLSGTSGQDANGCFSFGGSGSFTTATTVAGRGLEATDRYLRWTLGANLQAAADCLRPRQAADGRLAADRAENPVAQGDFATTAHGIY